MTSYYLKSPSLLPLQGHRGSWTNHLVTSACDATLVTGLGNHMDSEYFSNSEAREREAHFERSSGLVMAVADLLAAATRTADGQLSSTLDNSTLSHLANSIYREALVVETIFTQLLEIHDQLRLDSCSAFDSWPQIMVPIGKLSVPQLIEAKGVARKHIDVLLAENEQNRDNMTTRRIAIFKNTLEHLERELIKRDVSD